MMGLDMTPELFAAIRAAESEWLDITNEHRRQN
jgi:hypothetical protein